MTDTDQLRPRPVGAAGRGAEDEAPVPYLRARRSAFAAVPARFLRELADLAERREAESDPWRRLDPGAVDEALAMLAAGDAPALGWWRRKLASS